MLLSQECLTPTLHHLSGKSCTSRGRMLIRLLVLCMPSVSDQSRDNLETTMQIGICAFLLPKPSAVFLDE